MRPGRSQEPSSNEAPEHGTRAASRATSSALVVAGRVILLLLAAGAATFAFVVTRRDGPASASLRARYACPMHRQVTAAAPGECPICGMALQELAPAAPPPSKAGDGLGPRQYGIVDVARRRTLSPEVRAPAWFQGGRVVQALLLEDELATLSPGERGAFRPAAAPALSVPLRLADRPSAPWDASTSKVEFQLDARTPALRPGMVGWVELPARPRAVLVVPSTAVLQSGEGPYVLAQSPDGRHLARRPVRIGRTAAGLAVVVAGLTEGERVAVRGAFFLDAEQRLGPGPGSTAAVRP